MVTNKALFKTNQDNCEDFPVESRVVNCLQEHVTLYDLAVYNPAILGMGYRSALSYMKKPQTSCSPTSFINHCSVIYQNEALRALFLCTAQADCK